MSQCFSRVTDVVAGHFLPLRLRALFAVTLLQLLACGREPAPNEGILLNITGVITDSAGSPARVPVWLTERKDFFSEYTLIGHTTTSASGTYVMAVRVYTCREMRLEVTIESGRLYAISGLDAEPANWRDIRCTSEVQRFDAVVP